MTASDDMPPDPFDADVSPDQLDELGLLACCPACGSTVPDWRHFRGCVNDAAQVPPGILVDPERPETGNPPVEQLPRRPLESSSAGNLPADDPAAVLRQTIAGLLIVDGWTIADAFAAADRVMRDRPLNGPTL